jgi:hypothetical protein
VAGILDEAQTGTVTARARPQGGSLAVTIYASSADRPSSRSSNLPPGDIVHLRVADAVTVSVPARLRPPSPRPEFPVLRRKELVAGASGPGDDENGQNSSSPCTDPKLGSLDLA